MLLRMLEEGMPVDVILFCDTGMEFPQMYDHLEQLEQYTGRTITRLQPSHSFEFFFFEYMPKRKSNELVDCKGMSWPSAKMRWCTGMVKNSAINAYLKSMQKEHSIIQYIGIAADESHRMREHQYPLVNWGMTEADCLHYCQERGFDWGGLYDIFRRVSCWCCPLQSLEQLRKLRSHFPGLWQKLLTMDAHTWRQFRADYSAQQLEWRFQFEEQRIRDGLSIRSREFYRLLKEHLRKLEGRDASSIA